MDKGWSIKRPDNDCLFLWMFNRKLLYSFMNLVLKKYLFLPICIAFGIFLLGINSYFEKHKIVDGYTDKESYFPGEIVSVCLNSWVSGFKSINVYDLNDNIVLTFRAKILNQKMNSKDPWKNGFGYKTSFNFKIPKIKSGIYLIENKVPFIVKSKGPKKITLVYPSNTVNAYNNAGGKSAYGYNSSDEINASILSIKRPRPFNALSYCKELLIWLYNETDYEINYICDFDLEDYSEISQSEILVVPGHSEYWTRQARENFDKFVDDGGHAIVLSGNSMYWQVRYTKDKQKMIVFKDHKKDPIKDPLLKTDIWDSTFLEYPTAKSIGVNFTNGGFGGKEDEGWDGFKIVEEKSPLLRGTGLLNGSIINLKTNEYDGAVLNLSDKGYKLNIDTLNAFRGELIGYDFGYRNRKTIGTFIAYQRTENSGVIVNVSSTDWCNYNGISKNVNNKYKN